MKILIQILALYMLTISSLPCSDGGYGVVDIIQHLTEIGCNEDITHQHSGDCENHECPPFCVCSCCSPTTLNIPSDYKISIKEYSNIPFVQIPSSYQSNYSFSFIQHIWHPPIS